MHTRRTTFGLIGALVLGGLAWWAWPTEAPEVQEPAARAESRRAVRRVFEKAQSIDPAVMEDLRDALSRAPTASPEPEEPEQPALVQLVVDVVNEDGRPEDRAHVQVWGCPVQSRSGNVFDVAPGLECRIRAFRPEGLLQVPSAVERVMVGADGAYAQVELPRAQIGGLGIRFQPHADGMVVVGVHAGTPAEAMGLQHGDLITTVDGVSTSGLDLEEFVRILTGPVGSEVDFTLRYREDGTTVEQSRTLERAFLDG